MRGSDASRGAIGAIGAIGIIGAGRLGASLAAALDANGRPVAAIASRSAGAAEALAGRLPGARAMTPAAVAQQCALVFLTVPDGAIAAVAGSLPWRPGQWVVHASGALGLDALDGARRAGALAGCLHPLQTFPDRRADAADAARFRGITCGVEGAEPLGGMLERIARDLGAEPLRLEGVDRAAYHAAAVLASNALVALASAAGRAWTLAGLPEERARAALAPLLRAAAEAVAAQPLAQALTGPVARGDVETVERHLAALAGDAGLHALYRLLGRELLRLDLPRTPEADRRLRALLGPPDS